MGEKKIHSWYLRERIGLLKLKASEKATLSALVSHYPKAYASEVRLAALSGFSRRTVQRAIYSLIGKGYVGRTKRAGVTNLYQINADLILMHAADEEKKLPAKRAKAKAEHGERLRKIKRSCAPEEGPTNPRHGDTTYPRHGGTGSVVNPRHSGAGDPRHGDALNIPKGMFIIKPDKEASSRVDSDESTPACKDEDNDTIIELGEEPAPLPPLPAFSPPSPPAPPKPDPRHGAPPTKLKKLLNGWYRVEGMSSRFLVKPLPAGRYLVRDTFNECETQCRDRDTAAAFVYLNDELGKKAKGA